MARSDAAISNFIGRGGENTLKLETEDRKVIRVRLAIAAVLALLFIIVAHARSAGLDVTHTSVPVQGLPEGLNGLRIAQITDLHSSWFGAGQSELVDAVKAYKPDLIAITGDFIDGIHPDAAPCEALVRGLASVAPVYMVPGNHEYYLEDAARSAFESDMQACGARLLVNDTAVQEKNGQKVLLAGMDDMARYQNDPRAREIGAEQYEMEVSMGFMRQVEANTAPGNYPLKIMLCHEPPYWQLWKNAGYNLALCGHLHGWIFREPGIGGVLRRPSTYFPEEDAGLYDKDGFMEYISRGLDNYGSLSNFRMNNKPELALIEVVGK